MRKQSYVVVPNCIITDPQLYSSTKKVLVAMLAYCNKLSTVRKSLHELAALSGCSVATVQHALDELQRRGVVKKIRCFRYSEYLSRPVFDKTAYQINREKLGGSYTLIPRALLELQVTHSTFVAALYIYKTAGRRGRSFASLRTAAKQTYLSKSTICRALKVLRELLAIIRLFCVKENRAYSCNSYLPTEVVHCIGGLIFSKHRVINKITGVFIRRKKE